MLSATHQVSMEICRGTSSVLGVADTQWFLVLIEFVSARFPIPCVLNSVLLGPGRGFVKENPSAALTAFLVLKGMCHRRQVETVHLPWI